MILIRIALALVIALAAGAGDASARSKQEASYTYEQVWPAAVRFLRVDEGVTILEKDADTGYVLFEIEDDKKMWRGALEVVRIEDSAGRPAVRLILGITDRPSYVESLLLKKLVRKLVAELGHPPPPPRKEPTPPDDEKPPADAPKK